VKYKNGDIVEFTEFSGRYTIARIIRLRDHHYDVWILSSRDRIIGKTYMGLPANRIIRMIKKKPGFIESLAKIRAGAGSPH
jgi:hypothetical protein